MFGKPEKERERPSRTQDCEQHAGIRVDILRVSPVSYRGHARKLEHQGVQQILPATSRRTVGIVDLFAEPHKVAVGV